MAFANKLLTKILKNTLQVCFSIIEIEIGAYNRLINFNFYYTHKFLIMNIQRICINHA